MKDLDHQIIKVLLVDDDEDDYILTRYLFEDFKDNRYELQWTNSFSRAKKAMEDGDYDIYLIDYRLGAENGLDLIRQGIAAGCNAPMILLTGQDDMKTDLEAMQAGAADYLVKGGFEAELLERTIRYSLRQSRSLQSLQSSEMKFRSVIQSASDAIFLVTEDGKVTLWNKAAEKIFGYTEEEIIGKEATILMGEKYAQKAKETGFLETLENVIAPLAGQIVQATGRRRDGSEFPLEMSGSVWKTNNSIFYTSIIRDITDRKKAGETLKESEERYRDLFENANDTIYVHDLQGNFISVNQTGERVFGYSREEAAKLNMTQIVAPEYLEIAQKHIAAKIAGKPSSSYEIECIRKDGRRVAFEINSRVIWENGKPAAIQGIARDITDRKLAEEERDRLYNVSNDLLATISFDGTLLQINPAWTKTLGYDTKEMVGKSILDFTHPDDKKLNLNSIEKLKTGESISVETRLICKDESYRWISWNSTPMVSEEILYAVGRNITERKHAEEILEFNALYDKLTNLPNRTLFMNHLEESIKRYNLDKDKQFAVLFLDLDRFKIINDGLGHLIGDKLLIAIAERIKSSLRPGDIVARLGGDEFTLLIQNVKHVEDATNVAERIQRELAKPFRLENYEVFSSASIGIIISDETTRKPEDFLRDADSAMYRAKELGKSRYEIFDDEMHVRNMNLLQIETDLRKAIERDEFQVFYQPIVCLKTGQIKELEALIRWEHPEFGLVAPQEFINVAEETGLIIQIGEWILQESCRQTKFWQEKFSHLKDLSISVNLSAKQLMHPSLASQVKNCLAKTNLDPKFLKLEVTESMVMENAETALQVLREIGNLGVAFSTDDFGTGYSSLSYLHQFPFSRLKIDRSFIGKMDADLKSKAIVRTILMLGQNLGIEIVAEGVENLSQLYQLRRLGCNLGQGYAFSKPLNADFTEKLLEASLDHDTPDELELRFPELKENGVIEIENYQ